MLLFFFIIGISRLIYITYSSNPILIKSKKIRKTSSRFSIYDRNQVLLATSFEKYNVYLNTQKKEKTEQAIDLLVEMFLFNKEKLQRLSKQKKIVLIKRFISIEEAKKIYETRNNAFLLEKVYQRFYPKENTLSQTLGFVGFDGYGLTGIEKKYNYFLNNEKGGFKNGALHLSIDYKLQKKVEEYLKKTIEIYQGDSGSIIVQEIKTGKVRALGNYPQFNLNIFNQFSNKYFINNAIYKNIEPGSIFKAFFAAYLLEKGANLDQKKYISRGVYTLKNGEKIKDTKAYGIISFKDIIKHSINSGIIQACASLSQKEIYDYLSRFHFEKKIGIEFPGESVGIIPHYKKPWGLRTKATIPIGQGVAVSPLKLITAFSALIGDGFYKKPSLIEKKIQQTINGEVQTNYTPIEILSKVIETEIIGKIRLLLSYGTTEGSTGFKANQTDYKSIGKTSTSQLVNKKEGGYYKNKYDSIFVGAFPQKKPEISILVIVTNPKKSHAGGIVAASLYAKIVPEAAAHLKVYHQKKIKTYNNIPITVAKKKEKSSFNKNNVPITVAKKKEKNSFNKDKMPSFIGLSLRESIVLVKKIQQFNKEKKIKYSTQGRGYVYKQTPNAGKTLKKRMKIKLFFKKK